MLNEPPRPQHESILYIYKSSGALKQLAAVCSCIPNKGVQAKGIYKYYSTFSQKV